MKIHLTFKPQSFLFTQLPYFTQRKLQMANTFFMTNRKLLCILPRVNYQGKTLHKNLINHPILLKIHKFILKPKILILKLYHNLLILHKILSQIHQFSNTNHFKLIFRFEIPMNIFSLEINFWKRKLHFHYLQNHHLQLTNILKSIQMQTFDRFLMFNFFETGWDESRGEI